MMEQASPAKGATVGFRLFEGEAAWQALADEARVVSPFQRADWLAAMLPGLGANLTVIALDAGDGSLILPVTIEQFGPFRLADIAGGKQASFHLPIIRGDFQCALPPLRAALQEAGRALRLDAYAFRDMPARLGTFTNPLANLPAQPAPSSGWELLLDEPWEAISARLFDRDDRKKMRQKARKLEEIGPVCAGWVTDSSLEHHLTALFEKKAARLAELGQSDPFANTALRRAFLDAMSGERPSMRLFTLQAGIRTIAWMAGASDGRRFSGMVNAHDASPDVARASPGEQLLLALVPRLIAEGYQAFDLGVGDARYKAQFCPQEIALLDCALPVSHVGSLASQGFLQAQGLKRRLKTNPAMMERWLRFRQLFRR